MPEIIRKQAPPENREPGFWHSELLGEIGNVNIRLRTVSNKSSNLHKHSDASEAFYLLEGELTLIIHGENFPLMPGDFAIVHPGENHRISVEGGAKILIIDNIHTPAGAK